MDAEALAANLRRAVSGEVRFTPGDRALYATDGSNYRQVPIGVVIPRDISDVVRTIELCRQHGAPLLSRGGGTSLAGQCCNVAVIMDFSKYLHRVLHVDAQRRLGTVEPGCVLDDLRHAAEEHGLTFGPDPETHNHCCLGGMLGNNSCGVHSLLSVKAGLGQRTSDNTHELEILTYDGVRMRVGATPPEELAAIIRAGGRRGEIYAALKNIADRYGQLIRDRYPRIPRRVSGYNLDDLLPEKGFHVARALVGTESTCVTILQATMHLVPSPRFRSLLALGYPSIFEAGDHVMEILKYHPTALEGVDHLLFKWVHDKGDKSANLALLPKGEGFLLVEFGGASKNDSDDQARHCMEMLRREAHPPTMRLIDNPQHEEMIWKVRQGSLGSTAWVPGHPDTWEGWEDSAVAPERVGDYLRDFQKVLDKHCYTNTSLYGHLGQGCVHCRIAFDFYTQEGVENYRSFIDDMTSLVIKYGGSFSGEHGDGQSRGEYLPKLFGDDLMTAMREFKRVWDPEWKMNPGKVIDPYSITDNLRLGPDYNPPQPEVHFDYPSDEHSFSRAALRCVGIGECRRHGHQVMCPSYMVTREEKHSTRGRARLLWEMLNGDVLGEGWASEAVHEALDLCLACKGCKHDCPVNVDMATYKAEFLSHYYRDHLRPRHAYAFGYAPLVSRLVHLVPTIGPTLANFFTHVPPFAQLAKFAAGMEQTRTVPHFAPQSFQHWFRKHRPRNLLTRARLDGTDWRFAPIDAKHTVILFPDTFNNFYHPETSIAALEVLEHAGYRVLLPNFHVCCGRPFYDYGLLDEAKRYLLHILGTLQPVIQQGVAMIVLEPSCCAVFRDEMINLFPQRHTADQLRSQTYLLTEFLKNKAGDMKLRLQRDALVHIHCHHKSVLDQSAEMEVFEHLGLRMRAPEAGCCGMAGAFGFERGDHYDVSLKAGERVLLPEVRNAGRDTLIIADGFSCREQIAQTTNRTALHPAQVLQMALRARYDTRSAGRPEDELLAQRARAQRKAALSTVATLALAGAAFLFLRRVKNRRRAASRSARTLVGRHT